MKSSHTKRNKVLPIRFEDFADTGCFSELIKVFKAYTYMDQSPVQELDVHEGLENTLIVLRHKLKDIAIKRVYNRDLPRITAFGSALNEVWTILLNNAADALAALLQDLFSRAPASPSRYSVLVALPHHWRRRSVCFRLGSIILRPVREEHRRFAIGPQSSWLRKHTVAYSTTS